MGLGGQPTTRIEISAPYFLRPLCSNYYFSICLFVHDFHEPKRYRSLDSLTLIDLSFLKLLVIPMAPPVQLPGRDNVQLCSHEGASVHYSQCDFCRHRLPPPNFKWLSRHLWLFHYPPIGCVSTGGRPNMRIRTTT